MSYESVAYREAREQRERERAEREAQEAREQREAERLNAEARKEIDARNEAARKAKATEATAMLNRELEPQRVKLRNEWLASHPDRKESDFDRDAWPRLRENLIIERQEEIVEQARREMAASGRYAF